MYFSFAVFLLYTYFTMEGILWLDDLWSECHDGMSEYSPCSHTMKGIQAFHLKGSQYKVKVELPYLDGVWFHFRGVVRLYLSEANSQTNVKCLCNHTNKMRTWSMRRNQYYMYFQILTDNFTCTKNLHVNMVQNIQFVFQMLLMYIIAW